MNDEYGGMRWFWYELMDNKKINVSNIEALGTCSIAEGLKVNSTLKELNLSVRTQW